MRGKRVLRQVTDFSTHNCPYNYSTLKPAVRKRLRKLLVTFLTQAQPPKFTFYSRLFQLTSSLDYNLIT